MKPVTRFPSRTFVLTLLLGYLSIALATIAAPQEKPERKNLPLMLL
jgi:hypothetical protein